MRKTIARQLLYGASMAGGCFLLMTNTHFGQLSAQEALRAVGSMDTSVYLSVLNGSIQRFTLLGGILVSGGVLGILSENIMGAVLHREDQVKAVSFDEDKPSKGHRIVKKENPWKAIPLEDYENHMAHDSVGQLQILNRITKCQIEAYKPRSIVVLGVAGGNGLEHVNPEVTKQVYGYDVNLSYLDTCRQRFAHLGKQLVVSHEDLSSENTKLPACQLIIANLVVEYLGVEAFTALLERSDLKAGTVVSCVLQLTGADDFVSTSPITSLDVLEDYHQEIQETKLTTAMGHLRFVVIKREAHALNGDKQFIRLDYCKN